VLPARRRRLTGVVWYFVGLSFSEDCVGLAINGY